MSQLDLPLPKPATDRAEEFLVGPSNQRAVHAIEHWGTWPVMAALLVGPRKSGRSLLARLFACKTGGTMVDDAERASETDLFHAWNRAQSEHRPLLIVADQAPPQWSIRLPDLRSRMAATQVLRIDAPDDRLVADLFCYLCDRRGLHATHEVVRWVVRRVERSHLAVLRVVDRLEEAADARRSPRLSIPLARQALGEGNFLALAASAMESA